MKGVLSKQVKSKKKKNLFKQVKQRNFTSPVGKPLSEDGMEYKKKEQKRGLTKTQGEKGTTYTRVKGRER